ncbi:hypothetical protein PtrSN002B_007523 [Pyrenophora tritici-repentis]|uniref:PAT1 domain containing protein n=2 Tax=Pyrenophora tritici-repentis TaxID=45151 RepID=A0A2W1GQ63_9PLEO|nr:uncharacterized protein PTRG_02165 [Pyrenophora tritici-repentis Pt-1C-BFP]KAI0584113.1 PAT1 domain-containing protein [Pyrenophora tritici-repentis]EDU41603.1 predicted protein [Pyrenophora tritici-repentis Pt-1C-BFP]KAI0589332.1 PAT1 domain-containing protein [Pyrenophora tritici-repentis]KAI0612740.1 PAT1 domain-containing protein [Pyrenophora tritici-repentis]KAI0624910.1 PAT1 domain-containing protein [Pyrenophora tritici-repentis]
MATYDSNRQGYQHSQYYPPASQQQPPYPISPAPQSQPHNYFPPIQEQQPVYSSSPSQPLYSSSPQSTHIMMPQPQISHHRRSSSSSSYNSQRQTHMQPQPTSMPVRQPDTQQYQYPTSYPPPVTYAQQAPVYARPSSQHSHYSHHSEHAYDPHAYADGEDKYEGHHYHHYGHRHDDHYGSGLGEDTVGEYKRRYAKNQKLEKRPTLGDSLYKTIGKVGKILGSERH